ncbi:MAG: nuclear transport factor 2 family protein [Actinobacteria bacterium]|nr:nuclear transport factor 2 family protein [Actinomycetota bacterium]
MAWSDDDLMELLRMHTNAWNAHDIDALMALFAEDCVFEASGGSDVTGERYVGKEEVRAAFSAVFDSMPDARWRDGRHNVVSPGYGVSEWTLACTWSDGSRIEVNGCDFLTVVDGAITLKNSFRKNRPPLQPPAT